MRECKPNDDSGTLFFEQGYDVVAPMVYGCEEWRCYGVAIEAV